MASPDSGLDRFRTRFDRFAGRLDAARLATLLLAVVAGGIALAVASGVFPHRSLNHDEGVYLQQAAMLLDGHLFLSPPVEDAFRPWFFVESERGLYPKYAPVPAAVFALGRLLGGYAVALAGVAAAVVGLTTALGRELYDARTGLLAGVFLLASPLFLVHAGVFLPYALTTALNLAFALAYLRAERLGSRRLAALAGAAVGIAFFARPYTAVLFAAPFVGHAGRTLIRAFAADGESPAGTDAPRRRRLRAVLGRRLATTALGSLGVGVALGYNWLVTGAPLRFPYAAFAPEDGVGFGHREILGHEVDYTLELALRSNRLVLQELFTDWVVAGSLGTALAVVGLVALGVAWRRAGTPEARRAGTSEARRAVTRRSLLAGLFLSVPLGNLAFWGNYNVLGNLAVERDGLIYFLGPYYHYDLLVPTAVFAAAGAVALCSTGRDLARRAPRPQTASRLFLAAVVVVAAVFGAVAASTAADPLDRNREVSRELGRAYEPFVGEGANPPENAVVFLPTIYGPWLNHPFQALRNDPAYDGARVYALGDTDELRVADAFPDRRLYRYVFTGSWSPADDRSVDAELRPVDRVAGEQVRVDAAFGLPENARAATVRIETDEDRALLVANGTADSLALTMTAANGTLTVGGDGLAGPGQSLSLTDRDEVRVTVFVQTGASSGFSYRLAFPVASEGGEVTALSPTRERCEVPTRCLPMGLGDAEDGVALETSVRAGGQNTSATDG